jgi:hypothetical protein
VSFWVIRAAGAAALEVAAACDGLGVKKLDMVCCFVFWDRPGWGGLLFGAIESMGVGVERRRTCNRAQG